MRRLTLIAGIALALGACGRNGPTDETQNSDQSLSADNIVSNDVTAIDAVTGDAANMAAESEINDVNVSMPEANAAASPAPAAKKPAPKPAPRAAPEPVANTIVNSATNAAQ